MDGRIRDYDIVAGCCVSINNRVTECENVHFATSDVDPDLDVVYRCCCCGCECNFLIVCLNDETIITALD